MGVAIGVDSHKGTLAVGVLDNIGRAVGWVSSPTTREATSC
jgi:hypothetical protein